MEERILSITAAGSSFPSCMRLSRTCCSSCSDIGSIGGKFASIGELVLFESLLQKESRDARVLKTGDVATDASELGVEISDPVDCAEDGREMEFPASVFVDNDDLGVRNLIAGFDKNWTRGDGLVELSGASLGC